MMEALRERVEPLRKLVKRGARRGARRSGTSGTETYVLTRRGALAGLGGIVVATYVHAFPLRTVSIIVPYPAGGPVDVVARLIAQGAAAISGTRSLSTTAPAAPG